MWTKLASLFVPASLLEWARVLAIAFLVGVACYSTGKCDGTRAEAARQEAALEKANRQYLEQKARADAAAADQRLADTLAVSERERTLRDVIRSIPDGAPDAVRVQLGCQRLRAAGRSEADLPAACRPAR